MHTDGKITPSADLSAIIEGLAKANVRFILVGGLAAVVQGAPVTTMDVDIVYHRSPDNVSNLFSFLKSIDAVYRRPDDIILAPKEEDLLDSGHFLLSTRIGPIDVLAYIEHGQTYDDLLEHTIAINFRGHTIYVLDLKFLIELKKISQDSKNRQRLPVLEETLRQLKKDKNINS
jgi:hypothetical protein